MREWLRDWMGRVRGVSTPIVGVQWDPPQRQVPNSEPPLLDDEDRHEYDLEDLDFDALALFGHRDGECLWVDDVVDDLGLTWARAQHELDRLEAFGLLQSAEISHEEVEGHRAYRLTPQGRAIVVEHGLDEGR